MRNGIEWMMVNQVTLFYDETCLTCLQIRDRMAQLMHDRHIPFEALEVKANVDNRDRLIVTSGQIASPVVLVDKREIVGFDPKRLKFYLGFDVDPAHPAHW